MASTSPQISILGDSISTLNGFTPLEGSFYHTDFSRNTGISSVEDTWWMKVIRGLGGTLLVNNSYAGSTVCRDGYQAASSPWRIAKLKKNDLLPDYVLVFSGLNDVAYYRSPDAFLHDYAAMLQELRTAFPDAAIWCSTLCQGVLANPSLPLFIHFDRCTPLAEYNQVIRTAAAERGCHLADLAAFDIAYDSMDGTHPTAAGMEQLAQMWLRCLLAKSLSFPKMNL